MKTRLTYTAQIVTTRIEEKFNEKTGLWEETIPQHIKTVEVYRTDHTEEERLNSVGMKGGLDGLGQGVGHMISICEGGNRVIRAWRAGKIRLFDEQAIAEAKRNPDYHRLIGQ